MSSYIISLICIMCAFLPVYVVARMMWTAQKKEPKNLTRELVLGFFVVFMFGLLCLTFQDNGISWMKAETPTKAWDRLKEGIGVNFVPFRTIRNYLKYSSDTDNVVVNILGNILMFVPWGFGLPLLWEKFRSVFKVTFVSFALPIFIEFVQLFIGRSVDIDDVILNFAGGMIGGLLYLIFSRMFPRLRSLGK